MKEEVRHYLGRVFYQMSALSPHDFQTYEHMRVFAKEQLQMDLIPSHLPSQQLQQGVDIMQLLRELGRFVSKYNYNIHTQVFVETTQETR
jgi:WASH complex subunit 7